MNTSIRRIYHRLIRYIRGDSESWPATLPVPVPNGFTEPQILELLLTAHLDDAPPNEIENYIRQDYRRFMRTVALVPSGGGQLLEVGANPYFTTVLLKFFTDYHLTLTNYFGRPQGRESQSCVVRNPRSNLQQRIEFAFDQFNVETDRFPYENGRFDVVLFCEVIEHLQNDPLKCLQEIYRVLKPGGVLILTTPNVARLENVLRLVAGENIYDPYSGYGPYGRHNREYNLHELNLLLEHIGFEGDIHFTADVHAVNEFIPRRKVRKLLENRQYDLGQYLFFRVHKPSNSSSSVPMKRPHWLYRSYPLDDMA